MATSQQVRPVLTKRRPDVTGGRTAKGSSPSTTQPPVLEEQPGWWQQTVDQFNGNEGAGYAISFVVHIVVLMILAVPVIRSYENEEGFTTLVDNATDEQVIYDAPLDTIVATPEAASSAEKLETKLFDPASSLQEFIPQLKVAETTSIKGEGEGTGSGGALGGGRVAEPENAVRAGNFSVWNWPILDGTLADGQVRHGTPGEAPRVYQKYSIVIRVKVPDNKKFVRLSDFSGSVIGTDGYRLDIPEETYFFRGNGKLMKAYSNTRMPVINGTAEILVRVKGAGEADVKDTITVYSRILDEEQVIYLTFKSRN